MRFSIPFQNYVRDRKAAAAVEFVLVFPWFIFFVLLTAELGLFFFTSSTVEQAIHNYSRKIATMEVRQLTAAHADAIEQEILTFVGAELVKSFRFEIGKATPDVDFTKKIRRNWVDRKLLLNKEVPFYIRVVVTRPSFTYAVFKPLWQIVGDPKVGGLFSPIDIFVVNPFPLEDK